MLYTHLTKMAMKLCFEMHKEQVDKCGVPYPFHVAESMPDEYTTCAALLHDIIEDTDITAQLLEQAGFPPEVVEAVVLLTGEEDEPYFDYVRRIRDNRIAKIVKLADLKHNSDLSRLNTVTAKDRERTEKYSEALRLLSL